MNKAAPTKSKEAKYRKHMLVRYGRMDALCLVEHNETRIPKLPTRVVIKTERGLELCYIVGQLCPYRAGHFRMNPEQLREYYQESEIDCSIDTTGRFVRYATSEDLSEERHLRKIAEEEMEHCKRVVKEMDLPMKIVDAEHVFGGERIIFYFMADGRVDFRQLVRRLARDYQTRIEMRQIGSRDEAKLLGDFESCGQECCCRRFLKALKPVNMRMAKMQKATLDPSKISGYCGRLKCCLRYEDQTYSELKARLPKKNTVVKTKYGEGKVMDWQILTQLVLVQHKEGTQVAVPVEELEIMSAPSTPEENRNDTTDDRTPDSNES
jgi:cell fate regulator YaaT (PSP1 superfamily)